MLLITWGYMEIYVAMQYCSRCVVDTERGKVRDGEIDFLRENAKHVDTKSSHIISSSSKANHDLASFQIFCCSASFAKDHVFPFVKFLLYMVVWKKPSIPMYDKSELALYLCIKPKWPSFVFFPTRSVHSASSYSATLVLFLMSTLWPVCPKTLQLYTLILYIQQRTYLTKSESLRTRKQLMFSGHAN